MIKLTVGLVEDSAEVMVTENQTVREAFAAAGKANVLNDSQARVYLYSDGVAPKIVTANDVLSNLNVKEGDSILVTKNYKSASK